MKIETEIEVAMSQEEVCILWGIMHHHVHLPQLDMYEQKFRNSILAMIDPEKEYEQKYMAIKKR